MSDLIDRDEAIKRAEEIKNNEGKERTLLVETSVEDYLTNILSPEIMDYKTSSEKVNGRSYDYYKGIATSITTVQAEMYYSRSGDNMIIVTYIYGENPIHSSEVATVVGSINLE